MPEPLCGLLAVSLQAGHGNVAPVDTNNNNRHTDHLLLVITTLA